MTSDIVEIEQLLNRYCHAVDRGTVDDVMEVFHRDAVLVPSFFQDDGTYEGKAAVRGWYEKYFGTMRAAVRVLRHTISTPYIQVDGSEAESVCYLSGDAITHDGKAALALGRYEDRLIKEEGRWLIVERTILIDGNFPLGG